MSFESGVTGYLCNLATTPFYSGITVFGDRCWVGDSTARILDKTGVGDAARDKKADVLPFEDLEWIQVKPGRATNWKGGFHIPALVREVDHIISLPVAKTHLIAIYTMAFKNWVGIVHHSDRLNKLHLHLDGSGPGGNMIAELHLAVPADLYVMDATRVFVAGGPSVGDMREPGMIIATRDPIANDVTGLALLKQLGAEERIQSVSVWKQHQIARAVELGLGVAGAAEMELLGDGVEELTAIQEFIQE